jgi:non-heme Fe2+,alpha-ketoglutarate-dependent halogenase
VPEWKADPEHDDRDLVFRPVDPSEAKHLSAAQVSHFNEHGYISPVSVFERGAAAALRSYVDDLLETVLNAPDRRNAYSIISYHLVCAGMHDLALTPRILDVVEDLLGPDFVFWGSHLFCKLPGNSMAVPLHQDATYWPLTPTRSVSVWLAIDDADADNAAVQFAPGSHLGGALAHEEMALDGTRVLNRQVVGAADYEDIFTNRLAAGEASIHSDLLLHGSGPNRSTRRRAGITLRYAAAEVESVVGAEWFVIPAIHARGAVPDRWPNAPRPDGEYPERMAEVWGDFDGTPVDTRAKT